ncbi:MAG: sugar phosphate isomerase/epimerase family protein [Candidatus Ornithospirochaeta sp.]
MKLTLSQNILTPEVRRVPGMLASTGKLEEELPFLRDNGYSGLEFITTNPREVDVASLERLMGANGFVPVGVNTGRMTGELGLTLTSLDEDVRKECEIRMMDAIDFASIWAIPVNIGIIRGKSAAGGGGEKTRRCLLESLTRLSHYAERKGSYLVIETVAPPLSDNLNTLEDAKRIVDEVGSPSLALMYDFYQMDLMEDDIAASTEKYFPLCRHLHFADSERKVPGKGNIDFERIIGKLSQLGYVGPASIEIAPVPSEREAAREAAEYLLPLFEKYK